MRASVVAAVTIVGTMGCAPKIDRFAVLPHHICPGTVVTAAWKADGRSALAVEPPLRPAGADTYAPATDTTFTLTVTRWPHDPVVSQTAVTVIVPDAPAGTLEDDLPFRPECSGGTLVAVLDRPLEEWDPRLAVNRVSSDGRTLTVQHEGRVHTLTPQQPATEAFRGTRLGGQWRVSIPLRPPERCGDSTSPPPDLLTLTVGVSCTR